MLDELFGFVCGGPEKPPMPEKVLIVEGATCTTSTTGRIAVRRSELKTPEEYSARFDELMSANFGWLDVSYNGTLEGHGLVMVEYPRQASARRGTTPIRTSVNFSGPMKLVADAGAYVTLVP